MAQLPMQGQGPSLSEGQPRQERLVEIVELLFNSGIRVGNAS
jgi:hypothetical protein